MILRLAGGDLNALFGLAGFVCGILAGVFFLKRGYTLKRTYRLPVLEGRLFAASRSSCWSFWWPRPPCSALPSPAADPAPNTRPF